MTIALPRMSTRILHDRVAARAHQRDDGRRQPGVRERERADARERDRVDEELQHRLEQFAGGAFAMFEPSQQSLLYAHIIAPEGRIHFAGEHASLHHAWIQGAIESGLRAAGEINALGE